MRRFLTLVFVLVLAHVLANPAELLKKGAFENAYEEALVFEDYVLAARAASFVAIYRATDDRDRAAWFARAEKAARQAIQQDPSNPEAHFELARALGRLAQYRGILQSLSLASAVRDELKKTLKLKPDHAGALVALALWHLELSQKGVGWLYGADAGQVIPLFEKAIRLEPEAIIHRVEYAKALLRLGKKAAARKQLEVALKLEPKDARDRLEQARARALLGQK